MSDPSWGLLQVASDAPAGDFAFRFDKPKAGGGSTAGHKSNSRPSSAESKMAPVAAPALAQPAPEPTQPSQGPAPGLQHRLDFEGCPATAAMVVVDSAALRSCTLSDVAVEACADTVLVRVGQQQAEVCQTFLHPHSTSSNSARDHPYIVYALLPTPGLRS